MTSQIRVLFIGSNPSGKSPDEFAFHYRTRSGKTLYSWIERADIHVRVLANVSNKITPGNRPLTITEIRQALPALKERIDRNNCPVVAVGKTAARALTLLGVQFYELPHPSGLNRKLNNPAYIDEKIKGLIAWINPLKTESSAND